MNEKQFNLSEIIKCTREFDPHEIINYILQYVLVPMSWGLHNVSIIPDKALLFHVNGYLFKGKVLIVLDPNDTFTIYFIDQEGNVDQIKDVYIDSLILVLDSEIETKRSS